MASSASIRNACSGARTCPFCNFRVMNFSAFLSHLRFVHDNDPDFFLTCGIGGCGKTYRKLASYRTHVYRHHKDSISSSFSYQSVESLPADNVNDVSDPTSVSETLLDLPRTTDTSTPCSSNQSEHHEQLSDLDINIQQKASALFLLKMKEVFGLSQVALDGIVEESQKVFEHTVEKIRGDVLDKITHAGVDVNITGLEEVFRTARNPFTGLTTKYLQEQFYKKNFNLVVRILYQICI